MDGSLVVDSPWQLRGRKGVVKPTFLFSDPGNDECPFFSGFALFWAGLVHGRPG
jgi:hypothetical protein